MPLRYGATVVGVIVVSKLGLDQFDADDLRLLEVLAGHVSVALVNARLYEGQRREAESAKALLELTTELSAVTNLDGVLEQVVNGTSRIMESRRCSIWLPTADGGLVCRAAVGDPAYTGTVGTVIPREALAAARRTGGRTVRHDRRRDAAPGAVGREGARPDPARGGAVPPRPGRRRARSRRRDEHRRTRARAPRRHRQPGAARDHERGQLRDARADVPLDRGGARQRARGEGLVHVVARAVDLRHGDRGGPRARSRRGSAQAPRARSALPRHRQDRHPCLDPHEAGPADRRGACAHRAPSRARRADPRPDRAARRGQADRPCVPRALRRTRLSGSPRR